MQGVSNMMLLCMQLENDCRKGENAKANHFVLKIKGECTFCNGVREAIRSFLHVLLGWMDVDVLQCARIRV